jgi:predicted enzyme related to lactoylglutathione lyase
MSGRVVHFELPYEDADRARAFYTQVFGWQLTPMPEMDYTMVTTGPVSEAGVSSEPGYINGGLLSRDSASSPGPVVVVDVDDLDAALASVEAAGGSAVTGRLPVGEMGVTAYVRDTEGNVVGLWQTLGG